MSDRAMSPTAAAVRVRKTIRLRFKTLREDSRPVREIKKVDSPRVLAGRLLPYLEVMAAHNPGPYSHEWHEHVEAQFSSQYLRLSEVAPVKARRS